MTSVPAPARPPSGRVQLASPADPVVSVIVLGLGGAPHLLDCLGHLGRVGDATSFETIVFLNDPSEALLQAIDERLEGARVVHARTNLGFGPAINLAARAAAGRYLHLLNDDAIVEAGFLDALVECAERRHAAAVGSLISYEDGSVQEAGAIVWADGWTFGVGRHLDGDSVRYDYERRVDYCSACSLLVRRDAFFEVGGFDEQYFPAYFEDADLGLRLAAAGHVTWFQPRSRVWHLESKSSTSTYRDFLMGRHHDRFVERFPDELAAREPRVEGNEPALDRAVWRAMGAPTRVLLIDDRSPDPAFGSGFPRMADAVRAFALGSGLHLTLYASVVGGAKDHDVLTRLGVALADEELPQHLARLGRPYDAVVVSRPHNYERYQEILRAQLPGVPVIYDAEALYHVRVERQAAVATDPGRRAELATQAAEMRAVELAIAKDADHVVCLSREEAAFFQAVGTSSFEVVPPFLDGIAPSTPGFAHRSDFGMVAGWAAPDSPNADGLIWFVHEVLPLVLERVPRFRLLVTGVGPPDNVTSLGGEHLVFVGSVEDLAAFYAARIGMVSPMRYGSGVKIKTIEALQYAVPTVASSVAAEGLPLIDDGSIVITDDPRRFADALVELVDERAWGARRERLLAQAATWASAPRRQWPAIVADVLGRADRG